MKYKICVFILALIVLVGFVNVKDNTLRGRIIYLDPGHGGVDPGAVYKDIYEEKINLQIAYILKELLEENGATVYMTRYGDYDLSSTNYYRKRSDLLNRSILINNSSCDLYLSIHLNSSIYSSWNGAQVFYDSNNENNEILAYYIGKELNDIETKMKNDYYMYSRVKKVGVLIELGFISNANDRFNLQQSWYQKKLCLKIISGIVNFFNNVEHLKIIN